VADLAEVVTRAERDVPVPVSLRIGAGLRAAPRVWIDPDALRQVVVNLVRNARRAVAQRGSGPVTGGVTVSVDREAALVLRVDDDGIGMEAEVLPRAFDAFFSRDPKGTGLGLAVVRRLLDQLGASIELASRPGAGTRVTVRIPVPEKPPRMPPRGP
jgi:signal transduction histidine kinase